MKSTGLFGKNSGRVGGVVYSNYRGQQVVRAYQPQVKNPNTKAQIGQRAKFKLVSQLGAVFGKQLKNSYISEDNRLTSRNAWVRRMLKKTIYSGGEASLPIEEIILTNARGGIYFAEAGRQLDITLLASEWNRERVKVRVVIIAYSDAGEIVIDQVQNVSPDPAETGDYIEMTAPLTALPAGYSNIRAILYAYEPDAGVSVSYDDYVTEGNEAVLEDIVSSVGLNNVRFSGSMNIPVPQPV